MPEAVAHGSEAVLARPPAVVTAGAGGDAAARDDESGVGSERSATDAELVARVRRGDAAAFDRLVRRHLKAAHAVAVATTGAPEDADDVCQDAFLTALQRIDQCRQPDRFRAWLLTVVRNRAHNLRQYNQVRAAAPLESARGVASGGNPGRDLERAELERTLKKAVDRLTELQRNVLLLHDYEGWAHKEIADELGISNASSRFNLHVARKAVRRMLEGPDDGG